MIRINGGFIPIMHTVCAAMAFTTALIVGYSLHFHKIVTNAHYGYPDEWFPSVSATIGDRYPERSLFQILIAVCSFPRFLLLIGHYYLHGSLFTAIVGFVRTVSCGGWVYITSTDDHDTHDIFMFLYILLTIPWDICISRQSVNKRKQHIIAASLFFFTMFPLAYWFIQHQIHHVAGAYSIYAYFEWSLIILDVAFDYLAYEDFKAFEFAIDLTSGSSKGISINKTKDSDSKNVKTTTKSASTDSPVKDETSTSTTASFTETKHDNEEENVIEHSATINKKHDDNNDEDELEIVFESQEYQLLHPINSTTTYDSLLYIAVNTTNSFFFWSHVTSLACVVWHFPLWYMGISGYEISILSYVGCIILAFPIVPTIIYQYGTLIGNLITLGAYLVDVPESRISVLSIGVVICFASFILNLKSIKNSRTNSSFAICWLLGLVISVVLKMGFYSTNPTWAIMRESNGGINKTAIIIATIVGLLAPNVNAINFVESNETVSPSQKPQKFNFFKKLFFGLGFGCLFFSIHQLLTDASTIIYWSWEGFHDGKHGPLAWPWSALTCVVMLGATVSSLKFTRCTFIPCIMLIISTISLSLPQVTEWTKYVTGGLPYVISIIWFIPSYISIASQIESLWVFVVAGITYDIFVLGHVWTVAYAFVPLGWVLRERLYVVLCLASMMIIFGSIINKGNGLSVPQLKDKTNSYYSIKFVRNIAIVTSIILISIIKFVYDIRPTGVPQPYHPDSKIITAGIWTIHFGLDNDMWASEDRMIELIKDMELDVFGILETDTQRITMGNRDLTAKMAHDLNMYSDFGPGPNKHTWGCALFSKFPIVNSTHYLLPSPVGELAPAIHATLKTYDDILVDVFVFHSGQEEDEEDRRLQSLALAEIMGKSDRPSFLLSYLVVDPHEGNYNTYVGEKSGMHDIDPSDDDRWCEYILFKNIKRVGYCRVSRGTITDTELQVGKFQVLDDEQLKSYGDSIYENNRVEDLNNGEFKFPDMFLGEGERGHYYHVFDKPRYFYSQ
ncbi:hypothetical protein TBLA_0C01110 [Henningerozyma blattae CBS 6284]|uniref:Protein CWH43 n=1 Tax=Henningerozyma blattae (strain ATCC 34711 / CBS 6284 / DSM 70876 / NBRC 10599 / NRRL Y-10934 / UCD 77-7) TaxID=1071380 RepID=I2H0M4_HENB6|nr:hypothetical protein TBLA_0C01110 [Tetrapisispora blattae CBS 6284]CCH59926.1 hypothetical protein TBLA_0C01110 [Tetrapisispora blattae CBS 6284]